MKFQGVRPSAAALAVAAFVLAPGIAGAGVIDNTSLASPGVYFGTGNGGTNSGFTVDQGSDGIEIGLAAITRFVGTVTPSSANIYNVATGTTTVPAETGAAWGIDFSINTSPGGTGTLDLGDLSALLTFTDVGTGMGGSFSPFLIPDNAEYGPTGTWAGSSGCSAGGALCGPTELGVQNSEPSTLAPVFGDSAYDINANDTYIITLTVSCVNPTGGPTCADGTQLGSDTIVVNAGTGAPVPEPSSLILLASGLIGLGLKRRRNRRQA